MAEAVQKIKGQENTGSREVRADLSERDKAFREKSLNGSVWMVVLYVGLPLALYQSLQQVFSILDTMMASHIGAVSVSAVAYLSQIQQIIGAFGNGLAVGAGILISRAFGMGDYQLVKKRVSTLYAIAMGAGILVLVTILPFVGPFLRFAGTPEELIEEGASYFAVQLFVIVFTFLNAVYISVERARGNSKRILWLNMAVIITKLLLTALFVYVLEGDLVMIAVASLASQFVMLIFAVRNSLDRDNAFGFSLSAIAFRGGVTGPMITQSLPIMLEKALFGWGKTIINSMATIYGALMVGALGVSNNLGGITTMPQNGFQDGAAAVISQNFGAGKYKRVLSAFYAVSLICMIEGAIVSGIELLYLYPLSGLFASNDPAFLEMIATTYRYEALGAVPLGLNAGVMALLYGLGKTKLTLVVNFARIFVFRIPVFYFLTHFTQYGSLSCGMVMLISNAATGLLSAVIAVGVIVNYRRKYLSNPAD